MEILSRRPGVSSRTSGTGTFCFGGTRLRSCCRSFRTRYTTQKPGEGSLCFCKRSRRNGYTKFRIGVSSCALGQCSRTFVSRLERSSSTAAVLIWPSSSPLPRGTLSRRRPLPRPGAVHPRWRGEHYAAALQSVCNAGSSPLARGTLIGQPRESHRRRFIPAGAGNTPPVRRAMRPGSVHPRWRGEHAGVWLPVGAWPVHPRWRGEHRRQSEHGTGRFGSSPLARGTHMVALA